MINEHDLIALTEDLTEQGLLKNDVGTVVHIYGDHSAYEVEFVTFGGETVTVVTVPSSAVRTVSSNDLHHARVID